MPKEIKDTKNLLKLIIALLIFIIIIILTKELKFNADITLTDYDKVECSITNETSEEKFLFKFSDYSDLESFRRMYNISFDTCSDIRNYPRYIYQNPALW